MLRQRRFANTSRRRTRRWLLTRHLQLKKRIAQHQGARIDGASVKAVVARHEVDLECTALRALPVYPAPPTPKEEAVAVAAELSLRT